MKAIFNSIVFAALVILYGQFASAADSAPERVIWDKKPIAVHIQERSERIIYFPGAIRYWLPDSLTNKVSALSANGVLYLQAHASFPLTRIRVQDIASQNIYLLDVFADEERSVSDELVVMEPGQLRNLSEPQNRKLSGEDWRVRLTRYAAQQFYAPERILVGDPAIKRIPLATDNPIPLIQGGEFKAIPIAAWKGGGFILTAVKIVNQTAERILIRFDDLEKGKVLSLEKQVRGDWLTVTPQHTFVGPKGSVEDTTVLYLVSLRPLAESIELVAVNNDG